MSSVSNRLIGITKIGFCVSKDMSCSLQCFIIGNTDGISVKFGILVDGNAQYSR